MSDWGDFILPADIERMAQKTAQDIAEAWTMLEQLCRVRIYSMKAATLAVYGYMQNGLSEIESIRKVYHEVARS